MVLYLSEKEIASILSPKQAIKEIRNMLFELGKGRAQCQPRKTVSANDITLLTMSAAELKEGFLGAKNYTGSPNGPKAYYLLFSNDGSLVSLMEANELGRIRTGAATALATDYLARKDSRIGTLIGTGFQAETQLRALCEVREFAEMRIWGRNYKHAKSFCKLLQPLVNTTLVPCQEIEKAISGADVITTMTRSSIPLFNGDLIQKGVHINAVGSNSVKRKEIDSTAVSKADIIITDDIEQAKYESGDLIGAAMDGIKVWDKTFNLADLITDNIHGRAVNEEITLFKSNGIAIEDLAVAIYVYKTAMEQNYGEKLNI